MISKKKIIIFVVVIILSIFLIDSFLPSSLKNSAFEYSVVNDIEYISDYYKMGSKEYAVYAFLNDNGEENEFVVSTVERKGILKNKYEISLFSPVEDNEILKPNYKNIAESPTDTFGATLTNTYYGCLYTGFVPKDCKKLLIDGNEATLKHFTFDFKGEKVDCIFYYCFLKDDNEKRIIQYEID